jgi:phosphatidylethanolamine-binding protein (PEBP) family uncharacterized protein
MDMDQAYREALAGIPKTITLSSNSMFDRGGGTGNGKNEKRLFRKENLYGTCGGSNKMISLQWDPVEGSTGYALICVDHHPVAQGWVHLYAPYLTVSDKILNRNLKLDSNTSIIGKNSFGTPGWGGPCPPIASGIHRYVFYLFALKELDRAAMEGESEECRDVIGFLEKYGGNAVAYGTFEAYYSR